MSEDAEGIEVITCTIMYSGGGGEIVGVHEDAEHKGKCMSEKDHK